MRLDQTVLATLASLLLANGLAGADQRTVAVDYAAPPDCPRAAEFITLVSRRAAGSWRFREGGGAVTRFTVEIRDDGAGKIGRIRRTSPGEISEPRELVASNCREVVQALALTTALSLDTPQVGPGSPTIAAARVAPPKVPVSSRRAWMVGLGLSALDLLPPGPMAEATMVLENRDREWPSGIALHSPDLRLTLAHARNDVLASASRAAFSLSTVTLAACPVGWSVFRLCGTGEVGVLAGRGIEVETPRSTRSLWLALGARAGARWALTRTLVIEAQASVRAPLRRTDFVFEMPLLPVAKVPAAVASGGVVVGVTIP
jgi:hypothetical protein